MRACLQCGTMFEIPARAPKKKYCSKQCREKEIKRRFRTRRPERIRAYKLIWRTNNAEHLKEYERARGLKRKFRMTIEDYDRLLEAQNGACAICEKGCSMGKALAVDHNHTTGKIRQLLCSRCNTVLGMVQESEQLLEASIAYLQKHRGGIAV